MSELLEKILSKDNMNTAYKRVCANKGAGGVDEVTIEELGDYIKENWESIELNDNRISRVSAQRGKCAITKKQLTVYDMRVHKIYPNGGDGYRNIDIVSRDAYELIHTKDIARAKELIEKLLSEGLWNENALKKTNNYRILVGNTIIE